jgi:hypothetical protein
MHVQARVRGPHPGVCLAHRADDVLHVARPHVSTAGSEGDGPQMLYKDLEQWDRVGGEGIGIMFETGAEVEPQEFGGAAAVMRCKEPRVQIAV